MQESRALYWNFMEFAETENDMTRRRLHMRALADVMEAEEAQSQAGAVQQRSRKHRAGGFTKVARSGDHSTTGKDATVLQIVICIDCDLIDELGFLQYSM